MFRTICLLLAISSIINCSNRSSSGSEDSSSIEESSLSLSILSGVASKAGNSNGTGAAAMFSDPAQTTIVGANMYVTDTGNNLIRKVVIATGVVTTFAGNGFSASIDGTGTAASFNAPVGITNDGTNLYITEWSGKVVRQIVIATAVVTTLAGTPLVEGVADGTGAAASFTIPVGITTDGTNLFVLDMWMHTIRKIVISTGVVTTFAGTSGVCGTTDAAGTSAEFCQPGGITNDGTYLYVADTGNQLIRQVDMTTGDVTTFAGNEGVIGSVDGTGTAAEFNYPDNIAYDSGTLYVVDTQNATIRTIDTTSGVVATFAGTAGTTGYADGTGSAIEFGQWPGGISTDGTNVYIADTGNSTIRQIVIATAVSSTLAGTAAASVQGSTDGSASVARFSQVQAMATDGTNLYVTDIYNHTIRKIVIATGAVTTLAGTAGANALTNGTGAAARFDAPYGIAYTDGNLYVADYNNHVIRKIVASTGVVTTLAGDGVNANTDGTGLAAQFSYPAALATDGTNLYVAGSSTIRQIVIATGVVTTLAGDGTSAYLDGTGTAAHFGWITGLAVLDGNLYATDDQYSNIRKIVISTGVVTTLAGTSGESGFLDGVGTAARFNMPTGISVGSGSTLYVSDSINNSIRKINVSTGAVTTVIGSMEDHLDRTGSVATAAAIAHPTCVLYDSTLGIFTANEANVKYIH